MKRGRARCIALYDWEGEIKPLDWHEASLAFYGLLGAIPNKTFINNDSGKNEEFDGFAPIESVQASNAKSIQIYKTIPNYKQLVFGWDIVMSVDTTESKVITLCFNESLTNFEQGTFDQLITKIMPTKSNFYGISYSRDFEKGPDLYASGMIAGLDYSDEDMVEADEISTWMYEIIDGKRHKSGLFRDIYPENYITQQHLKKRVGGLTVEQWIIQNDCGELRKLNENITVWSLTNEQITVAQREFSANKLLIKDGTQ